MGARAIASIIELSSAAQAQAAAAREWRKAMHLTVSRLSMASGWSDAQIEAFERGYHRKSGKPIPEEDWHKYRLVCAALNGGLETWKWRANQTVEIGD